MIDPRTGSSLESGFVQVSVVANLATTAEMICKLAFFGADVVRPFESEFQVLLAFNAEHKSFNWENSSFTTSE